MEQGRDKIIYKRQADSLPVNARVAAAPPQAGRGAVSRGPKGEKTVYRRAEAAPAPPVARPKAERQVFSHVEKDNTIVYKRPEAAQTAPRATAPEAKGTAIKMPLAETAAPARAEKPRLFARPRKAPAQNTQPTARPAQAMAEADYALTSEVASVVATVMATKPRLFVQETEKPKVAAPQSTPAQEPTVAKVQVAGQPGEAVQANAAVVQTSKADVPAGKTALPAGEAGVPASETTLQASEATVPAGEAGQKPAARRRVFHRGDGENILQRPKADRRLLSHVPDPDAIRTKADRRGELAEGEKPSSPFARFAGQRYESGFGVEVSINTGTKLKLHGKCVDVSQTGMQVIFPEAEVAQLENQNLLDDKEAVYRLHFKVPPGTLGEGMEKTIRIHASMVRRDPRTGGFGFLFTEPLYTYFQKRTDRVAYLSSALMLFFLTFFIVMLRYESVLYLQFTTTLSIYSIIAAVYLLSRYLFGALYRPAPVDPSFTPGVTIIIPCFNEEEWIERTILSCVDQNYPVDKLEVIVVDDCSTDDSFAVIQATMEKLYKESERFKTRQRVTAIKLEKNSGKREALAAGVFRSTKEFVTFVDSDSFLEPDAIRNLVQPFFDPKVDGVSGRTDVANTFTNGITKMQAVRYFIAFRIMKAAESYFDSVLCLSGPLSCYRKQAVLDNMDHWLNQKFFGQKATFGDDRALTHMVVKKHRTVYQDTAICSTVVPHTNDVLLKQQMRWKRSWLRESLVATKFMWRKEPFMALFFYMGVIIPVLAPIIVLYNLVYVPIVHRLFPTTFLLGLLSMALLMSFAQLLLRKSSLWLYGLWFCIYYEAILLWQMPWAWVTFWVSTWGTRMTPADVAAKQRRDERRGRRSRGGGRKTAVPGGEAA